MEKFAIAAHQDRALEHATFLQWKEAQNLHPKPDSRKLGRGRGTVMGGKFLKQLYAEREEAERKKREKREKQAKKPIRVGSRKKEGLQTPKQKG